MVSKSPATRAGQHSSSLVSVNTTPQTLCGPCHHVGACPGKDAKIENALRGQEYIVRNQDPIHTMSHHPLNDFISKERPIGKAQGCHV